MTEPGAVAAAVRRRHLVHSPVATDGEPDPANGGVARVR
jgi:hypothetical protein